MALITLNNSAINRSDTASADDVWTATSATATDFQAVASGGITVADQWRLTTTFTGDAEPIASNLERVDTSGQGTIGSAMTESSGVFTFPSTGIYSVTFFANARNTSGNETQYEAIISYSSNAGVAWSEMAMGHNGDSGSNSDLGVIANSFFDITDVSNQKVRFVVDCVQAATMTHASSTKNSTYFNFVRLGDT